MSNTPSSLIIEYKPGDPLPVVGDYATVEHGELNVQGRLITGFIDKINESTVRIKYAGTYPITSIKKYIKRNGVGIPLGTHALPINHL
jgi:hypothetical protein